MKNPILTISLLCSGREDTTDKCLSSLNHLREAVPSELIITDTGCPECVKAILRKYADKILPFTWVNDFSAARNVGLEAAKGEWFLYLDDDEWFENTEAIESFFLSGEYKRFDAAFYRTRDYQSLEPDDYKMTDNLRLFSLANGSHFESRIHEQIVPARKQIKLLPSFTHHYGYVYETAEKRQAHHERNLQLLQEELKEHPQDASLWAHLANEYRASEEYGPLKVTCEQALEACENSADDRVWVARPTFLYGILECTYRNGENEEENEKENLMGESFARGLELCRQYEAREDLTEPAKASIYYFGAMFANRVSQCAGDAGRTDANFECLEYCDKYLKLYQSCSQNRELLQKQFSFFCESIFEDEAFQNISQMQQCAQLKINIEKLIEKGMADMAKPMIELIVKLYPKDRQARKWREEV